MSKRLLLPWRPHRPQYRHPLFRRLGVRIDPQGCLKLRLRLLKARQCCEFHPDLAVQMRIVRPDLERFPIFLDRLLVLSRLA